MADNVITIHPSKTLEDKLIDAAQSGDIHALYQLIGEDVDVLKGMDMKQFFDTPLHIGAAAGKTEFALEMMYLKPSFATKLNKDGLSPVHLALQNGNTDLALSLLKMNRDLASVKGKMGYSPIHYLAMKETGRGNLMKFLTTYPECIDDVTSGKETALHVAASNSNLKALEVILRWLKTTYDCSMHRKGEILNRQNSNGDTVLHLHVAVSNKQPDPKIVKLLKDFSWIDIGKKNSKGLTALDILKERAQGGDDIKKCTEILSHQYKCLSIYRKVLWFIVEMLSQCGYEIKHMSSDSGNALLVVTVLILTATYTATLSPPGGVLSSDSGTSNKTSSTWQIYLGSNNTAGVGEKLRIKADNAPGSSVLQTGPFLWFFIPNMVAFAISFLLTCLILLSLVSGFLTFTLILSLAMLLFTLLVSAVMIVSPNDHSSNILLTCVYVIVYATYFAIAPVLIPRIRRVFR